MPDNDQLAREAIELARRWVRDAASVRPSPSAKLLGRLVKDEAGLKFALAFVDRVVRPEDVRVAARALAELAKEPPRFLPFALRFITHFGRLAPLLPHLSVRIARWVLRSMVAHLVIDARPEHLSKSIARLRAGGDRLNINLLGEAVLGDVEAKSRLEATRALIVRPDVDYVSIKVSSVAPQLSMWAFDEFVDRVVKTLTPLYKEAANGVTPTFINLDMEEYRDLNLTVTVFTTLLDQPELRNVRAGIVLQTYLPDTLGALDHLTEWAQERVDKGGAPIKVRIVKGANLAMEHTDAVIHGWEQAPYGSKMATDANYKRVLSKALHPERTRAVKIGVAGHNLFDIAFAYLLGKERQIPDGQLEFEMLLGMAEAQALQVRATVNHLLLYTPVVEPHDFEFAIAYLVRRLEENASNENFMSAIFELTETPLFEREQNRFMASVFAMDSDENEPRRQQSRLREEQDGYVAPSANTEFVNEPDTDPALADNRAWGRARLEASNTSTLGEATVASSRIESEEHLLAVIDTAKKAAVSWQGLGGEKRAELLQAAGDAMAAHRGDLIEVMAAEAGKTIDQADPEISEAIDFARYYARSGLELEKVSGATFKPDSLTVVTPPWNFPVAIPAGSVLAALAAGSAVIIKPAKPTRRCAAVMVEALWEAGIPREVLQFVDLSEREFGKTLISHPDVDRVVLTGSFETASLFRSWRPRLPLLAETSGKNAIIVTPSADFDQAVMDTVRSAFGHAGQKCSAASLLILVGSVGKSERFERQLIDAIRTVRVGYPQDPLTTMGPVIDSANGKLLDGLTKLDPGQRWLLEPRKLDDSGTLWSPGVRTGVEPGSEYHLTEYFGPILGIMRARTLEEAVAWQNGTDYGLTAGLHTLDPDELAYWLENVQAGNLYVNRVITGAIVERQAFGGWKKSSVGGGTKAGGPSYLLAFGEWEPALLPQSARQVSMPEIGGLLALCTPDEAQQVQNAMADDALWFEREYGKAADVQQLGIERNVMRYRPMPVSVRVTAEANMADLVRQLGAANRVKAPIAISLDTTTAEKVRTALAAAGAQVMVETTQAWVDRLARLRPERVRVLGPGEDSELLATAIAGDPGVAIISRPSTWSGRIELLSYLREQAISITAHRFGEPDDWSEAVL